MVAGFGNLPVSRASQFDLVNEPGRIFVGFWPFHTPISHRLSPKFNASGHQAIKVVKEIPMSERQTAAEPLDLIARRWGGKLRRNALDNSASSRSSLGIIVDAISSRRSRIFEAPTATLPAYSSLYCLSLP